MIEFSLLQSTQGLGATRDRQKRADEREANEPSRHARTTLSYLGNVLSLE